MSVVFASAHLGIIHDQTTIEAFETVEFLMRSVRSATKHRDGADRAGFGRGDQVSRSLVDITEARRRGHRSARRPCGTSTSGNRRRARLVS
jgi:hypothetical protein